MSYLYGLTWVYQVIKLAFDPKFKIFESLGFLVLKWDRIKWWTLFLTEVIPNIYLSSGNAAANEQNIVKNGITLIINATPDLPEPTWTGVHRVKHVRVALRDRPDSDLKRVSNDSYSWIILNSNFSILTRYQIKWQKNWLLEGKS